LVGGLKDLFDEVDGLLLFDHPPRMIKTSSGCDRIPRSPGNPGLGLRPGRSASTARRGDLGVSATLEARAGRGAENGHYMPVPGDAG
jgi:hypothetical protein